MKLGISIKIDVTKIDKSRLFIADSGAKYLDLTTFVDPDNPGQYGDHGFVTQSKNKGEDTQMPILGNVKVFWQDQSQGGGYQQGNQNQVNQSNQNQQQNIIDSDIPF